MKICCHVAVVGLLHLDWCWSAKKYVTLYMGWYVFPKHW